MALLVPLLGGIVAEAGDSGAPPLPRLTAQAAAPPTPPPIDPTSPIIQGNYWALVIGINAYPNLPSARQLTAASYGAEALARVLRQYGVERERITALYDARASRERLLEVLQTALPRDLRPEDSLLVYFAGHCQVDAATKEVWWLPADAQAQTPATLLALSEIQLSLAQLPARHILVIADTCVGEGLVGTSRISGDPTIRGLYQRKSRWVLSAGVPAPQPRGGGDRAAPSPFTQALVDILRDQQLPYLTPLHLGQELAERLSPAERQMMQSGPMTGAGDEDGQFVFRLEGASPPAFEMRVPAKEDPRVVRLRQQIEIGRSISLPVPIKEQVLADLQRQVDVLQAEAHEQRRRQEEARLRAIEAWRSRQGR